MLYTPLLKSVHPTRLSILWKKNPLSPAQPHVITKTFLDPPPYAFNDELEIRNRLCNRRLHWIRIINAIFTFSFAIAIVACTGQALGEYSKEDKSNWYIRPWPANLDVRATQIALGCSICIMVANLIYIIAAFTPLRTLPKLHGLNITSTVTAFVSLSAAIFSIAFTLASRISQQKSQISNMMSWACAVQASGEVGSVNFERICNLSKAANGLMPVIATAEIIAVVFAVLGWWLEMRFQRAEGEEIKVNGS